MPELTHINRLPGHAHLIPFSDATSALASSPEDSPYFQCFNGRWRFRYLEKPESVTVEMLSGSGEECTEIDVPGVWTRQGYGHPHDTNIQIPFPNDPPDVPEENPVGIYQRRIQIPAAWQGRRTIADFGGAESVLLVFVDGKLVGLSKDSRLPSELDLTNFVTPGGDHLLTAVVIKWSDASFIEDQWWMGGLHRDVSLYSTDNDGLELWSGPENKALGRWLGAGLHELQAQEPRVALDGAAVTSREDWTNVSGQIIARLTSRFFADDGWMVCDHWVELDPDTPEMPLVGLAVVLKPGFENLAYFVRGPWENYIDRKRWARLAIHESTVTSEYVPYVMPQEHGNHTDCRWLRIAGEDSQLELDGGGAHFGFAARHFTDEDLFAARHTIDLPMREKTFLHLDHRHTGLGTASCGPGRVAQHQILEKSFAFRFRFRLGKTPGGAS